MSSCPPLACSQIEGGFSVQGIFFFRFQGVMGFPFFQWMLLGSVVGEICCFCTAPLRLAANCKSLGHSLGHFMPLGHFKTQTRNMVERNEAEEKRSKWTVVKKDEKPPVYAGL